MMDRGNITKLSHHLRAALLIPFVHIIIHDDTSAHKLDQRYLSETLKGKMCSTRGLYHRRTRAFEES